MNRRRFLKKAGLWVPASFAFPAIVRAQRSPFGDPARVGTIMRRKTNAAGCDTSPSITIAGSGTSINSVGDADIRYYNGNKLVFDSVNRSVCRVDWKLGVGSGNIASKTVTCQIWTVNDDVGLVTSLGSSSKAGNSGWNLTWVEFDFSTPVNLTASTEYACTLDIGGVDAANYLRNYYAAGSGYYRRYKGDLTQSGGGTNDIAMKVYWWQ